MIYCIGLGREPGDLSVRAAAVLDGAPTRLVRTAKPACVKALGALEYTALDSLYEAAADFDALSERLADAVLQAAEGGDVAYCLPGAGSDRSTAVLVEKCRKRGQAVTFLPAAGAGAAVAGLGAVSYAALSAYDIAAARIPNDLPVAVFDIDDALLAGEVKLKLSDARGDDALVYLDGVPLPLCELDRQKSYSHDTTLVALPLPLLQRKRFTCDDLADIVRLLRAPGGCPWDGEQTHTSIRCNAIEEAYEVVDAIDNSDTDNLREELGDLILQGIFHAVIAEEDEEFTLSEVFTELCAKLIYRHPHVLGAAKAGSGAEALSEWENAKAASKKTMTLRETLQAIPKSFPQLLRAYKVIKKTDKATGVRVSPEAAVEALKAKAAALAQTKTEAALGETLLAAALVGVTLGIEPETALNRTVDAYIRFAAGKTAQ